MDKQLSDYLDTACYRRPDGRIKLVDLSRRFKQSVGRAADLWPRWRFIAELRQAGYVVGTDADHVVQVAGLAWRPAQRWTVDPAGRLRLASV